MVEGKIPEVKSTLLWVIYFLKLINNSKQRRGRRWYKVLDRRYWVSALYKLSIEPLLGLFIESRIVIFPQ